MKSFIFPLVLYTLHFMSTPARAAQDSMSEWGRPYLILYVAISLICIMVLVFQAVLGITGRHARRSIKCFYRLSQKANEGMLLLDAHGGILEMNPAAQRMLGASSLPSRRRLQDCLDEHGGQEGGATPIEELLGASHDVTISRKDLPATYAELMVMRLEHPGLYGALIHDTSARSQLAESQQTLVKELRLANKELEHFAFAAAHDLQEPLRLIAGFSTMLRKRYGGTLDASGLELINMLITSSQRLQQLVLDLYHYTQTGQNAAVKEEMDCRTLTEHAILNLKHSIDESNAVIHLDELPIVRGFPTGFILLMQNLVGNAIKYVVPGTKPDIRISAADYSERWLFSVIDNGIGIDEAYYVQIFSPFKRLHNQDQYKGSGMGLAICRKIVKQHGGDIWVESTHKGGSQFYFTIPK